MSGGKIHIWKRYLGGGKYRTQCCRVLPEPQKGAMTPTFGEPRGATCLQCLRAVRDAALRQAAHHSEVAMVATELLEKELRKR